MSDSTETLDEETTCSNCYLYGVLAALAGSTLQALGLQLWKLHFLILDRAAEAAHLKKLERRYRKCWGSICPRAHPRARPCVRKCVCVRNVTIASACVRVRGEYQSQHAEKGNVRGACPPANSLELCGMRETSMSMSKPTP
eukprot:Tamp_18236.p2 GENE.Tamp_18236~~Tamp_18236.p2  ORF type:complete len:141 (-),score=16.24 Tamp_18236:594-1016(-)